MREFLIGFSRHGLIEKKPRGGWRLCAFDPSFAQELGVSVSSTHAFVLGGHGVSGQVFVDNAALREYAFRTFQARVLDMETAAIGHVAYANGLPFIAFRSLSDLAGGGAGENEMGTFLGIAADNSARVLLAFLAAWK